MKRSEKIDLIKSGKYIIENDMKGSDEAINILNKCEKFNGWSSEFVYYGLDKYGCINFLTAYEAIDRPRFKMSELVGVEETTEPKEVYCIDEHMLNYAKSKGFISWREMYLILNSSEIHQHYRECFQMYSCNTQPTEPKEVFTVDEKRKLLIAYELKLWLNPTQDQIEIAEKLVDMYLLIK